MAFGISGFNPLQTPSLFSTPTPAALTSTAPMMEEEGCSSCSGAGANMDGVSLSPAALQMMQEDAARMAG